MLYEIHLQVVIAELFNLIVYTSWKTNYLAFFQISFNFFRVFKQNT